MVNNNKSWTALLGLAYRARKVVTGEETVIQAIRRGQAKLVLLSDDASNRTMKTVTDKCQYYGVPYIVCSDRKTLGQAIGKAERVVIAITDRGFGDKLQSLIESNHRG
ncbi:YlxQ family RNA-binding protein [Tuberibacillus calidus]|jgi:ribosomal protein L7Ae-like RNA K-turn-binding protein|uniref:YlxQ family RNA-binding protein n=1 Tax=Tuberibacillus calidus TaxID=340097 RepID=UPI0004128424|nr:YlxQ family RNA-binding protein [Tuberibacillus calidus]